MRLDILIQFIVPLTFLAIWALTTLLNRDAQPLPPRPGKPQPPRPGVPPARAGDRRPFPGELQPMSRPPDPTSNRGLSGEPNPFASTRTGSSPAFTMDDAIVYLENDPRTATTTRSAGSRSAGAGGTPASSRPQGRGPGRRSGRSRAPDPAGGAPSRNDGRTRRVLSDEMQEAMALRKTKPLEIAPLGTPMKRLDRPLTQASASPQVGQDRVESRVVGPTSQEIRRLLVTPERLREAFVLTEILRPPLALRRRR